MATEKRIMERVISEDGSTAQVLFETSADQVTLEDAGGNYTADNVEGALNELAAKVASAGKVDDVVNADGTSIVENKVAQMQNAVVKQAGKVASSLRVGGTDTSGEDSYVSFDGSKGKDVIFVNGEFNTAVKGDALEVSIVDKGYVTETELTGKGYATKSYTDTELAKKLDKAGGTVTGALAVNGGLTVGGNLTVNGTTTTVDSTTLQVKDKLIEVAHGNTTKLTTPAGLVAPKYDGTNSGALVFDGDGIASVGDVVLDASGNVDVTKSNLQPLATRTGLVDGNLVKYDGTNKTLVDTGKKVSDLVTTNTEQEITAAKTFKDEYGTVVINGEITYTPAAASIGGVNINNENGDRVIGVFANEDVGQLSLGSSTGKEAALLLKGEPGEDGQVLVSRGRNKTPAWSNSVGQADRALYATRAGSADKVANKFIIGRKIDATNILPIAPIQYDGSKEERVLFSENLKTETKEYDGVSYYEVGVNNVPNILKIWDGVNNDQAIRYDGHEAKELKFDAESFNSKSLPVGTRIAVALKDTGVTAGTYSAVTVDTKGRVTYGNQIVEWGTSGQTKPTSNLVVGGLFMKLKQ